MFPHLFQFVSGTPNAPGEIPYNNNDSRDEVAQKIIDAIDVYRRRPGQRQIGLGLSPRYLGKGQVHLGSKGQTLTT